VAALSNEEVAYDEYLQVSRQNNKEELEKQNLEDDGKEDSI